ALSAARVMEASRTPPSGAVTTFASLRDARDCPALTIFRDTTDVRLEVTNNPLRATSSADVRVISRLPRSVSFRQSHQRLRFTRTSIKSAPVWNTLELAV